MKLYLILPVIVLLSSCQSKFGNNQTKTKEVTVTKQDTKKEKVTTLYDGFILKRKIDGTPFYHFGVVKGDKVIHFDQLGVHESTSLKEFAKGFDVEVVSAKPIDFSNNMNKLKEWKNQKYDMMTNNCEHFAYDLVFNKKVSIQTDKTFEYLQKSAPVMEEYLIKKTPKDSLEIRTVFKIINKQYETK
jgi:hypothetical protein